MSSICPKCFAREPESHMLTSDQLDRHIEHCGLTVARVVHLLNEEPPTVERAVALGALTACLSILNSLARAHDPRESKQ